MHLDMVYASVDVVSRVPQGFRTVVVYIVHLRALSHCCESYCELCGLHYDICSDS